MPGPNPSIARVAAHEPSDAPKANQPIATADITQRVVSAEGGVIEHTIPDWLQIRQHLGEALGITTMPARQQLLGPLIGFSGYHRSLPHAAGRASGGTHR